MLTTLKRQQGLIAAAVCCALLSGCKKNEGPEELNISGTVEKISANSDGTGEITALYYSEKQKQNVTRVGKINAESSININGQPAGLSDLRKGDRMEGTIRIEGSGNTRKLIVLAIRVERATMPNGDGGP